MPCLRVISTQHPPRLVRGNPSAVCRCLKVRPSASGHGVYCTGPEASRYLAVPLHVAAGKRIPQVVAMTNPGKW